MSTGTTRVATGITATGALALTGYGILTDDLPRVVGGAALIMTVIVLAGITAIHTWITDTGDERTALAAAQRSAQDERTRYIAARAGLTNDQARLVRDLAAERASLSAQLKAERAAMEEEFASERGELQADALALGALMERGGVFTPNTPRVGNLIPFPQQELPQTREHGVVRP
ncbi:hypothetical protein [Streptomyces bauhiniae]|uniref:Uncharacterized protein n=1 Tax=Streptomyces bauhiniae TaxID=2340725 RepID=A0A7K3QRG8_9ACTN|nr:hypothetical protein [Streptomyces bauhiniae]NEB92380.1 hypothetical protein [Streptomyces bauhiniae]